VEKEPRNEGNSETRTQEMHVAEDSQARTPPDRDEVDQEWQEDGQTVVERQTEPGEDVGQFIRHIEWLRVTKLDIPTG
jgi:hypothetical protein